ILWRYRLTAAGARGTRSARATALAGLGYFSVWTVFGAIAFPVSVAVTRFTPGAVGAIVGLSGAWQLTTWKAAHLACFREIASRPTTTGALRDGVCFGIECARACGNLMIIPLILGTMGLPVMAAVATAITLERIVPGGVRVARAVGIGVMMTGLVLMNGSV